MSTSFKKPLKKAFRKKQNSGSEDEEEKAKSLTNDRLDAPPEVTVISSFSAGTATKLGDAALDEEPEKPELALPSKFVSSKLSFEDEEDESEEFRVKKSNRSRKIAQKLKEEWKGSQQKDNTEDFQNLKISGSHQVSTRKNDSPEILFGDDVEETDSHDYRPPGTVHSRDGIPDSKQIALAKKKREEARKGEEYVPLDITERVNDNKSRLVREDDNDLSDEDAEIVMPSTTGNYLGSRRKEEELRQRNRDFYELDERMAQTLEESDDEIQRWEEAQLRKGVTLPQIQALSEEMNKPVDMNSYQQYMYTPQYDETTYQAETYTMNPAGHYTSVTSTVEEVRRKIKNRMELAKEQQRRHKLDLEKVNSDLDHCSKAVGSLTLELESASFEYKFYQEVRGFVWDVVDCYNSKLPQITNAENELLALWKKTYQSRVDLRQQYIKDKSDDISGKTSLDTLVNVKLINERKVRLADYYERRKSFAFARGIAESEASLEEAETFSDKPTVDAILATVSDLFQDTVKDFKSVPDVVNRFAQWRTECFQSYSDAWIAHCFPKLVAPLVRYQLLGWNPMEKTSTKNVTEMSWFKDIAHLLFGEKTNQEVAASDPDLRVVPIIIEDVVFSKLTVLLDIWDPLSSYQTGQLVTFLQHTFRTFPVLDKKRKPVEELFRAIVQRLRLSIEDDVYLPLYSQRLLESDAEASRFAADQYRSAFKLFCNALSFYGILSNSILVELAIERLLNRYLLTPIRNSNNTSESVQRCTAIAQKIPDDRLQAELADSLAVPKYLEQFCHAAANLGKKNPNREEVSSLARVLMRLKDFDRAEDLEKQLPKIKA